MIKGLFDEFHSLGFKNFNQIFPSNSKISKTSKLHNKKIVNFGIPADTSADGTPTCPFAKDCKKYCFAKKGHYVMGAAKRSYERRYQLTKSFYFVDIMTAALAYVKPDYVRIHDSGDFYSIGYINNWIEIMSKFPEIKFYAYTKSFMWFKHTDVDKLSNFVYKKSFGGTKDSLIKDGYAEIYDGEYEGEDDATEDDLKMFFNNNVKLKKR